MITRIKHTLVDGYRIGVKDLLEFVRDKMRVITWAIMPLFMMVMMGFIFPSGNIISDIPVILVNHDQDGNHAKTVLDIFKDDEEGAFEVTELASKETAIDRIKERAASAAIIIPSGFSESIDNESQGTITIIVDQSNPQLSLILDQRIAETVKNLSKQIAIEGYNLSPEKLEPVIAETEGIVPGESNYFQFMAPGIMAMVVTMAVMTGLAASISREKELGMLDGILAAPISRLSIVLGKTFSQIVRGLLQGGLVLILAIVLFDVAVYGSIPLIFLILVLGIFSFVGLGVLISSISTEQETAMTIMMTIQFPMIFLSGAFFPIQQMPGFLQLLSQAIPLTHTIQALRQVVVLGAGISSVTTELAILACFGAVMLVVAIPLFNRAVTR